MWLRQGVKARRTRDEGRVKALMAMRDERGARRDVQGNVSLKIDKADSSGKMVFEADWHTSISANPYQAFFYKAQETGEFSFVWKDDNGSEYKATAKLAVS